MRESSDGGSLTHSQCLEISNSHQRDRRRPTDRKFCVTFSQFVFTLKIVRAFRAKTVFSPVIMPSLERPVIRSSCAGFVTKMNHVGLKEQVFSTENEGFYADLLIHFLARFSIFGVAKFNWE